MNDWLNNREADDLRRHRAHYGVIIMKTKDACDYQSMPNSQLVKVTPENLPSIPGPAAIPDPAVIFPVTTFLFPKFW